MPTCAICEHLSLPAQAATGTVGLMTAKAAIVEAALDRFAMDGEEAHVVVHACPEHVVDVYRGRIDGVRMAWRLGDENAIPFPRSREAASASPA